MVFLPYILALAFLFALCTFALTYFLHFFGKKRPMYPSYAYLLKDKVYAQTALDKILEDISKERNGLGHDKDALGLIVGNLDAFAARMSATLLAGRSLDLMYYIWEDDLTGRLLLNEVLKAADRGVRVRLLLDDINAYGRDPIYAALDQHENIEVRIFNPCVVRSGRLNRAVEMIFRAFSLTRRMHNKAYIVDGRLAFVGGRNIGDPYFDASQESNFRDLDLLLVGPTVEKVEAIFDRYWNSSIVQPINFFAPKRKSKDLEEWRFKLVTFRNQDVIKSYIDEMHAYTPIHRLLRSDHFLYPVEYLEFFSDPPEKALDEGMHEWMIIKIFDKLKQACTRVAITSPYFVPGKFGVDFLGMLVKKNVDVQILTNSLAAIDVPLAYGGYILYRKKLLQLGVKLFELKPDSGVQHKFRFLRFKKASLHTKAFLIDQKFGFVGSFNFDSRSVALNTEMGLFFDCPALIARMDLLFSEETTGEMSYALSLTEENKIIWRWIHENKIYESEKEPHSSLWRRWFVKIISWLPIESQL